ncbi:MAG: tetratricopeptide repeat protein [Myxococcota bacterium]
MVRHAGDAQLKETAEACLAAARRSGEPLTVCRGIRAMASLARRAGDFAAAEACEREILAVAATEEGCEVERINAAGNLGSLALRAGRLDEAEALLTQALAGHRRREWTPSVLRGLQYLAHVQLERGDAAAAVALLEEADQAVERSGSLYERMVNENYHGWVARLGDDWAAVLRHAERARALAVRLNDASASAVEACNAAEALLELGRAAEAEPLLDYAVAQSDRAGAGRVGAEVRVAQARLLTRVGRIAEARAAVDAALPLLGTIGGSAAVEAWVEAGHVALAEGGDAAAALAEAERGLGAMGVGPRALVSRQVEALRRAVAATG